MLLYIILLTAIIIFVTVKVTQIQNYWKNIGVTHHATWPILGYMAPFIIFKTKSLVDVVHGLYNNYPNSKYVGTNQFLQQILVVRDIDIINKVLIKDFDHFIDRTSSFNPKDDSIAGKNLFALEGEKWRSMRNILSPAFTSSKMKIMFHLISDCAEGFTNYFEKQQVQTNSLEIKDIFTRYANDIIATVAFGIKCNSLEEPNNEFYLMGKEVTKIDVIKITLVTLFPSIAKFFGIAPIRENIISYFCNIIQDSIHEREKANIYRPDLIHLLMEARQGHLIDDADQDDPSDGIAVAKFQYRFKKTKNEKLSDIDIAAQAFIFFFAGFETTSTFMSLTSYELATNPEVQQKLQNEIDEIRTSCQGKVTYEKLMGMKYLDMVLAETLRKWPVGFMLDRLCVKDYTIVPDNSNEEPLTIKKGQGVLIPVYGLHRDPQFFPNPEKFAPERFSQENKSNFNPRTYFPFGVGPRSCIASRLALLETKILFFYFLSKFNIVVVDKTEIPLSIGKSGFDLLPAGGIWLGFEKRN